MAKTSFINKTLENVSSYLGTFACDKITSLPKRDSLVSLIINLDKAEDPGSHWTALSIKRKGYKKSCYFYDPLGSPCTNNHILEIVKHYKSIQHNNQQVQAITSRYCGIYCIAFVLFMDKGGESIESFNNMFVKSDYLLSHNDKIVVQYVLENKY